MLGGLLSLLSAVTFAYSNASVRRGVLTGSAQQAVTIGLPVALPLFAAAMLMTGGFHLLAGFPWRSLGLLALAGVIHFAWARRCNYRATKAIGANLVAPVQQFSMVITLVLAVWWLGERLTLLRIIGIVLVFLGPALTLRPVPGADPKAGAGTFMPNYAEGYSYALLSSLGFGITPILIGMAFEGEKGLAAGIAGGFVSYAAATAVVFLMLLWPGQWHSFRKLDAMSCKWFVVAGLTVGFSQMFRYMALAIAPVSVVTPIQRLSLVFRVYFGWLINPQHEVFGGRVIAGTVLSLLGAVALSVSTDSFLHAVPLPADVIAALAWHWP
jgi:uncharacterized membrane protein